MPYKYLLLTLLILGLSAGVDRALRGYEAIFGCARGAPVVTNVNPQLRSELAEIFAGVEKADSVRGALEGAWRTRGLTVQNSEDLSWVEELDSDGPPLFSFAAHYDGAGGEKPWGPAALVYLAEAFHRAPVPGGVRLIGFDSARAPSLARFSLAPYGGLVVIDSLTNFNEAGHSQSFPSMFFRPRAGNFLAVSASVDARVFLNSVVSALRANSDVPFTCYKSYGTLIPPLEIHRLNVSNLPYPAIVISDTGEWRKPAPAAAGTSSGTLDRVAQLVAALEDFTRDY